MTVFKMNENLEKHKTSEHKLPASSTFLLVGFFGTIYGVLPSPGRIK